MTHHAENISARAPMKLHGAEAMTGGRICAVVYLPERRWIRKNGGYVTVAFGHTSG